MDIRTKTAHMMKRRYGIEKPITLAMFDDEVLMDHQAKKALIRDEYLRSGAKLRLTELKIMLADKYCVSLSTVEKYVAGQ